MVKQQGSAGHKTTMIRDYRVKCSSLHWSIILGAFAKLQKSYYYSYNKTK